jgi:hypothetical protein
MFKLKSIHKQGIPRALEKIERYRLLNEPIEAESICRDILDIDSENQQALINLILSLTDQFIKGIDIRETMELVLRLKDEFNKEYYKGIILERQGKAALMRNSPGFKHDVYEWFVEAMECYEKAEKYSSPDNDDAILRWNTCARIITRYQLTPRPPEKRDRLHLPLE